MAADHAPYPGLRSFKPDESDIFFGRDKCIDSMLGRLAPTRFLAVLGSSGIGKSSLVKTGLLPALRMGLLGGAGSPWLVVDFQPGLPEASPLRNLARGLLEMGGKEVTPAAVDALRAQFLRAGPRALLKWCEQGNLPQGSNLLLLVDQFEELFRYQDYSSREEAEAFVALLLESRQPLEASTPQAAKLPIYVALTMRSEFLGACSLIENLPEAITEGAYLTPRMTREEYREAIVGPADVYGIVIGDALVNRLLNDLATFAPWDEKEKQHDPSRQEEQVDPQDELLRLARRADQLPVLQHVLNRMWQTAVARDRERRQGADAPKQPIELTLDDYNKIGGLETALNKHADEVLDTALNKHVANVLAGITKTADGSLARHDRANLADWPAAILRRFKRIGTSLGRRGWGSNFSEKAYAWRDVERARTARSAEHVFRALITGSTPAAALRRPAPLSELIEITGDEQGVREIVEAFRAPGCNFLMPETARPLTLKTMVTISHESLIRQWDTLRRWLGNEFEAARHYRRIEDNAKEHAKLENAAKAGPLRSILLRTGIRGGNYLKMPILGYEWAWWQEEQPNAAWAKRYGGSFADIQNYLRQSRKLWRAKWLIVATVAASIAAFVAQHERTDYNRDVLIADESNTFCDALLYLQPDSKTPPPGQRAALRKMEDAYTELINNKSDEPQPYFCRGVVKFFESLGTGQYGSSITDITAAIDLPSDRLATYEYWRGIVYRTIGSPASLKLAIVDLSNAIELSKGAKKEEELARAYRTRGYVYFLLGEFQKAAADLSESIDLRPNMYAMLWQYLAERRSNIGKDTATANLRVNVGKLKDADKTMWQSALVQLYFDDGTPANIDDAIKHLMAAPQNDGQKCEMHFYLGEWYLLAGERDAAKREFTQTQVICPVDYIEYQGAVHDGSTSVKSQ